MAFWNPFRRKKQQEEQPEQQAVPARSPELDVVQVETGEVVAEPIVESVELPTTTIEPVSTPEQPPAEPSLPTPSVPSEKPKAPQPSVVQPKAATQPVANEKTAEKKSGLLGKFRSALKKTVQVLNTDIRDLVGKDGRLVDDDFLDELYTHLVKTDMGVKPASRIRDQIKTDFRGRKVMMSDLVAAARETIYDIMHQDSADIQFAESGPTVIMVVGVNGSGKTTSIAKLTRRFTNEGKKVVLGAGDTFRAAAVEQLTIWAERLGASIATGKSGADPASVAYRAVEMARNENADVCIVDTAGRLQTQTNLMDELGRIRRVIAKLIPGAPHEVLLVLDATAGQNGLSQARGFSEAAGCTGIVLSKLDGTARGGVAIPIRQDFGLPVKFVGLGEKADDFETFDVENYIRALFDSERS